MNRSSISNNYNDFEIQTTRKLFKKYNLNYDINSLCIVMEIQDELSLIEKIILKEIKSKVGSKKYEENV